MDPNQSTPMPERQLAPAQAPGETLSADRLETKAAPVAAETAGQSKSDDGTAAAQAHVASVASNDNVGLAPASASPSDPANPPLAADVDVIEPEWVKKAEEAVAKHRDNPRAEEAAVEELQRNYLKARYNLDVKPGDESP